MGAVKNIVGQPGYTVAAPPPTARTSPQPLCDAERDLVAKNRDLVIVHMPELVPLIHELHALGMIPGWRAVKRIKIFEEEL